MTRSATKAPHASPFHTAVRRVRRVPIWISVVGWVLVLANVTGALSMLSDASGLIPGIGSTGPDKQALTMIAARQLGQAFILAFALLYRDVRVLQAVFLMVFIREAIDLAARLESGAGISPIFVIAMLALELGAFIHLGAIASGRVRKYLPAEGSGVPSP